MNRRPRMLLALLVTAGLLGALLAGHAAGLRVLWFVSGSMSPTIPAGSVALSHPIDAGAIEVGDVLSIVRDGERVTHRAIAVEHGDGTASIVLRGDANEAPDPAPYLVDAADRVMLAVPPIALVLIALAAAAVVVAVLLARRRRAPDAPRLLPRVAGGTAVALVAVTAVAVPTSAYWTDGVQAQSGTFAAGVVPEVTAITGCENAEFAVALQWQHLGDRFHYRVELWDVGAAELLGDDAVPYNGAVGTITHLVDHLYLTNATLDPDGQYSLRVYTVLEGGGGWEAAKYAAVEVSYDPVGQQLRCGWDSSTEVAITAISTDSFPAGMQAQYGADFITNVAAQTISGTGEVGTTIQLHRGTTLLGTTTVGANGTWSIAGVTLTAGAASYVATATDAANNTASDDQAIVLDQTAPTVTQAAASCGTVGDPVVGVSGATWCRQTSLNWTMTAADNAGGSGIAVRQYTNAGSAWTAYTGTVAMAELRGRTMQARAIDVAGNVSANATGTYYIDGTAPTLVVRSPQSGSLALDEIIAGCSLIFGNSAACGTVSDAVSGPVSVGWYGFRDRTLLADQCLNASGWSTTTCSTNGGWQTLAAPTGGWAPGATHNWGIPPSGTLVWLDILSTYEFRARATDEAGNVSAEYLAQISLF